jgi:SulP family sulfate permease
VVFLGDWVALIPMAALVAVMIMVSIGTFSWRSIRNLREHPAFSSNVVMIATVVVVVWTHNLAQGVFVGVLLGHCSSPQGRPHPARHDSTLEDAGSQRTYKVVGQVFFASADKPSSAASTSRKVWTT